MYNTFFLDFCRRSRSAHREGGGGDCDVEGESAESDLATLKHRRNHRHNHHVVTLRNYSSGTSDVNRFPVII